MRFVHIGKLFHFLPQKLELDEQISDIGSPTIWLGRGGERIHARLYCQLLQVWSRTQCPLRVTPVLLCLVNGAIYSHGSQDILATTARDFPHSGWSPAENKYGSAWDSGPSPWLPWSCKSWEFIGGMKHLVHIFSAGRSWQQLFISCKGMSF